MVRACAPLAAAVCVAVAVACQRRAERTAALDWGVYQIYGGRQGFAAGLTRVKRDFATSPRYVMFYRDLAHLDFPADAVARARELDAVPIVSLELWSWHDKKGRYLPRLERGEYDAALASWAAAARREGGPVFLRFGFEMNGNWFSWNGDPERFRRVWRRAREIFRRAGARNVTWVWSPNVVSVPETAANSMHRYYPGDDAVDWVALDGYNFGDDHDQWHRWESFASVFRDALDDFQERYPGKPVMIAETGCARGPHKAQWIRDAHAWLCGRCWRRSKSATVTQSSSSSCPRKSSRGFAVP